MISRSSHQERSGTLLPGILVNWNGELCSFSQTYVDILEHNGIKWILLDPDSKHFWKDAVNVTHLLFRHTIHDTDNLIGSTIIPIFEKKFQIPCLPSSLEDWHYDDKVRQFYLLSGTGIPYVRSWAFWRESDARTWLEAVSLPVVLKLPKSAGSQNVVTVTSMSEGERLLRAIFKKGVSYGELPTKTNLNRSIKSRLHRAVKSTFSGFFRGSGSCSNTHWRIQKEPVLFQEFLASNPYDTRVTILGKRAFAFRRYNREGDFRASGSGLISYEPDDIDLRCIEVAFKASRGLGFLSMTYDFLFDASRSPTIIEMSYSFADRAVYDCPGHWDLDLNWRQGHLWPQYCHLVDLLNLPELDYQE